MDYLQLPMYVYIVIVSSLEKRGFQFQAAFIISLMITLVVTPLLSVILLIFRIYKQLIIVALRALLPVDFVALMEGVDSICCNQVNCIPTILLLVDSQDDISAMRAKALQLIANASKSEHKKLFYSRDSFMGYHYFVKNRLKPHDYITVSDDGPTIRSKAELSRAFQAIDAQLMPDGGRALLQIVLFRPSIQMGICDHRKLKLVAFRLHHSLGDGRAIMNLFASVFGDVDLPKRPFSDSSMGNLVPEVKRLKDWPPGLIDDNPLRGYHLSECKHIAWFSDADKSCMDQIRHLRHAITGVTFLDVVNTCIASSLRNHYERNALPIPKSIVAGVVLSPAIYNFSYGDGNFMLNNRFSAAAIHLPIGDTQLRGRLKLVNREYDHIKKCVDVQLNYWIAQSFCDTIPAPIVRTVCANVPITVGISSLPGCERFTLFAGSPVEDFILMLPNSPKCGLHFAVYTYGGNFRVALTADDSILTRHEDAQTIVDDVISYLKELHQSSLDGRLI